MGEENVTIRHDVTLTRPLCHAENFALHPSGHSERTLHTVHVDRCLIWAAVWRIFGEETSDGDPEHEYKQLLEAV